MAVYRFVGHGGRFIEAGRRWWVRVLSRSTDRVTIIEVADRLLAAEEPKASALITEVLQGEHLAVVTGATVDRISHDGDGFHVNLDGSDFVTAERLLVVSGRRVDLAGLGIDTVGLDPGARSLMVDDRMRAGEGLWAVGDVTGHGAFTHIATYQATIAVRDILGTPGPGAEYDAVPG